MKEEHFYGPGHVRENVSEAKTTHNQSLSFKNVMSWGPVHTMSDRSTVNVKDGKG